MRLEPNNWRLEPNNWRLEPNSWRTDAAKGLLAEKEGETRRLGNYSISILGRLAMRLKERRRQKKEQEGGRRNETLGVWQIKLGGWEW